jgi:hypothetical protein
MEWRHEMPHVYLHSIRVNQKIYFCNIVIDNIGDSVRINASISFSVFKDHVFIWTITDFTVMTTCSHVSIGVSECSCVARDLTNSGSCCNTLSSSSEWNSGIGNSSYYPFKLCSKISLISSPVNPKDGLEVNFSNPSVC